MRSRVSQGPAFHAARGLTAVLFGIVLATAAPARAASVSVHVPILYLDVGESADVVVSVSLQAPAYSVEAALTFAPEVVFGVPELAPGLCSPPCVESYGGLLGRVDFAVATFLEPIAGGLLQFDLGTVTFTGRAPGETNVVLDPSGGADGPWDNAGAVLVHIVVPEPAALAALLVALGLAALRRRTHA